MHSPYKHAVRVGYADTDQGGIAHHSVYPRWMEEARVAYLREAGVNFAAIECELGISVVVVELSLRYRLPAHFEEVLYFETRIEKLGHASLIFSYRVTCEEKELCTASVKLACIDLKQKRPRPFPPEFSVPLRQAMAAQP